MSEFLRYFYGNTFIDFFLISGISSENRVFWRIRP